MQLAKYENPGCVATGKTIDTVLRRIARAIELHVRGLREDGLAVPRPKHRSVTPSRGGEIDFYATVEVAAQHGNGAEAPLSEARAVRSQR